MELKIKTLSKTAPAAEFPWSDRDKTNRANAICLALDLGPTSGGEKEVPGFGTV
jgi:hypothetical protein